MNKDYMSEGMDVKKLLLCFLSKIWIPVAAAVAGALIGGGLYLLVCVAFNPNREYEAVSKLYLTFATDETGEVYQYYNGYTWNDLLATSKILDGTMSYLPADYTEEEVIEAATAEILSDRRVLTITVNTASPERTDAILQAFDASLVDMGQREIEFENIEVIQETAAKLLTASPRLAQACGLGAVIFFLVTLLVLALVYTLEDKIALPGDCRRVTDVPFAGFYFTEEETFPEEQLPKKLQLKRRFTEDTKQNLAILSKQPTASSAENAGQNPKTTSQQAAASSAEDVQILSLNRDDQDTDYTQSVTGQPLVVAVPYRKMDRASFTYALDRLSLAGAPVRGYVIADPDMRFLTWYYRHL